jgi:hypothetical protein
MSLSVYIPVFGPANKLLIYMVKLLVPQLGLLTYSLPNTNISYVQAYYVQTQNYHITVYRVSVHPVFGYRRP